MHAPRRRPQFKVARPRLRASVPIAEVPAPPGIAPSRSRPARIEWGGPPALHAPRAGAARRFGLRHYRTRPPALLAIPRRMRLDSGGEIDRIGDTCYATPGGIADNGEANGNPVLARVERALRPLFVHEVPCDAGRRLSFGEDFLRHLDSRAADRPPG